METKALGRQLMVEFYDCRQDILDSVTGIETAMMDAALASGATIVEKVFHRFSPWGVSGVVVIAESHLAVHTWPEYGYAAVDLFTCGDSVDPWKAYAYLKKRLEAQKASTIELKRGQLDSMGGEELRYKPLAAA